MGLINENDPTPQERIECLLDLWRTDLGKWEVEFLMSVRSFLGQRGFLTSRQAAKLDEIWARTAGKSDDGTQEGRWA